MLVTGLTKEDMAHLDFFEGGVSTCKKYIFYHISRKNVHPFLFIFKKEYVRREVLVYPLEEFRDISSHSEDAPSLRLPDEFLAPLSVETYIYCEEELEAKIWSYEDFVKVDARRWY